MKLVQSYGVLKLMNFSPFAGCSNTFRIITAFAAHCIRTYLNSLINMIIVQQLVDYFRELSTSGCLRKSLVRGSPKIHNKNIRILCIQL